MQASRLLSSVLGAGLMLGLAPSSAATPDRGGPADYWTAERRAAAIPRDLVVDDDGRGYLRLPDGTLEPYGTSRTDGTGRPHPQAKPSSPGGGGGGGGGGSFDTTGPLIEGLDPGAGAAIPPSYGFSALVTDMSGVRSVVFHLTNDTSRTTTSYSAASIGSDRWGLTISGLAGGGWTWVVEAKDGAKKGGNTTLGDPVAFTVVDDSDGGTGTGEVVTDAAWSTGGLVQTAAGRIYFEMPSTGTTWGGYVCSGTVATDETTDRSVIITAAHCVYDDAKKVFARNVLFIPNQDATTGTGTDRDCTNDPLGCWAPTHGVVDDDWANRTWPDNIPWDYAYYVVPDTGAHSGTVATSEALDVAAGHLPVWFSGTSQGDHTHALGYSYDQDPDLRYCAEGLGSDSNWGTLFLGSCDLSGGASGGPWVEPMDLGTGSGPIISVNSYGYSNRSGMGAPRLTGSASCVFAEAKTSTANDARGTVVACSGS